MSDEQTIYISPEDELTAVRERLEQIQARHLTMVIPPQTQLRSHIAWKLLYARARELGKEIVIVSSDPQVRSVAHAVKFKVAHSLESSPTMGRSHPTSRSGHASGGGVARTRSSSHLPSTKATSEPRSMHSRRGASNMGTTPPARTPKAAWHGDPQDRLRAEDATAAEIDPQAFDTPEQEYRQPPYDDFRIDTPPAIHPLTNQIEEPDLLLEDYTQAQDIRSAAREGQKRFPEADTALETRPEKVPPSSSTTLQPHTADNLFTCIEDDSYPPHTGEDGVVSLEGVDTHEHIIEDIEDVPDTVIIDNTIEDQGDRDEIVPPLSRKPITYLEIEQTTDDEEQEKFPSRTYGVRSRHRRSSKLSLLPQTPLAAVTRQFEEDALPPVEEHHIEPRSSVPLQPRASGASSPGKLGINLIPRTSIGGGQQAQPKSSTQSVQQRLGSGAMRTGAVIRQYIILGSNHRKTRVAVIIAILLLLASYLLIYFGPTAKIRVSIATQNYSKQVTLTAKTGKQAQNIKAQQFSKSFMQSGMGTATGSQLVGTNFARGNVVFTYTGSNPNGIVIPSGSIVTTSGDNTIQFTTTTEVLVLPSSQNKVPPPVSIQAVKPGNDGNVDAGVITVISDNTLSSIAQAQNPPIKAVSDVNLAVVNNIATTGGGAKPTPMVTNQDLSNMQNNLKQQLQSKIQAWQQHLPRTGAIGTPYITNTWIGAPKANDIAANGTFSATIKITATVLLVRTTDLQKEAIKQLNDTIKNDKSYTGDIILTNSNPTVSITQLKLITADANSITVTFNATAKAGPGRITKEYIQPIVKGKSIADAKTALITISGVKTVNITVSPSFMPWVPSWTGHIDITIIPL